MVQGDTLVVEGAGTNGLREAEDVLDAGNSGTTMRLMSGILAGRDFKSTMTGDSSLQSRPMGRIIKPLSMMGAVIRGRENNTLAPLEFDGGEPDRNRIRSTRRERPVKVCDLARRTTRRRKDEHLSTRRIS